VSEPLRLLLAQVDDVPGELVGEFMRRVEEIGARNVHVVPTIAKKGRPGYLIYVDVPAALEDEIGLLFGSELGTWGYRVLAAEHKHFDIARRTLALDVVAAGQHHAFELRIKTVGAAGRILRVKAEHDDLVETCRALRTAGHTVPLAVLKATVETQWTEQQYPDTLSVQV
jgi:uncharacterized protein (DUF111 family)